jgi:hypothetical protein
MRSIGTSEGLVSRRLRAVESVKQRESLADGDHFLGPRGISTPDGRRSGRIADRERHFWLPFVVHRQADQVALPPALDLKQA